MAIPAKKRLMTVQEYYVQERAAGFKSEYYEGEIFAVAGSTIRHSRICTRLLIALGARLNGSQCEPVESNLRLRILATGLRCYPDATVFCDPMEYDPEDVSGETVTNPSVIFEVLSESTKAYDRGAKSNHYRQIKSLKAYALISQDAPHVEMYVRQPDNSWLFREYKGIETSALIAGVNLQLPLTPLYDGIDFSNPESVKL